MYLYFQYIRSLTLHHATQNKSNVFIISTPSISDQTKLNDSIVPMQTAMAVTGLATRSSAPMNDPYAPPLKNDGVYFPPDAAITNTRGIPINVQTRGYDMNYTQIGILTRIKDNDMILPLMGRRNIRGSDKWQYYTISNSGNLNTKLPIRVKGKNCTGEYGCDEIYGGDTVFVEGYGDTFKATIYENSLFSYIPF